MNVYGRTLSGTTDAPIDFIGEKQGTGAVENCRNRTFESMAYERCVRLMAPLLRNGYFQWRTHHARVIGQVRRKP